MELASGTFLRFGVFSIVFPSLRYPRYCVVGVITRDFSISIRDHFWTWTLRTSLSLRMPPWTFPSSIGATVALIDLDLGNACTPWTFRLDHHFECCVTFRLHIHPLYFYLVSGHRCRALFAVPSPPVEPTEYLARRHRNCMVEHSDIWLSHLDFGLSHLFRGP